MEVFIYCSITLLVLVAADPNPHSMISSSLTSVPKFGDRLKTPELTLYLTRDVVKALHDVILPKKSVSLIESSEKSSHTNEGNYNEGGPKTYDQQYTQKDKSLKKNRGFVSRFFHPKEKEVIFNQENNALAKFYFESLKIQKIIYKYLQNSQQNNANDEESQTQASDNLLPYILVPNTNQEEILLQEQLKQQWNRILDHNRAELQDLSASRQRNEDNNQSPPVLIHSELRITKHQPVPFYKLV